MKLGHWLLAAGPLLLGCSSKSTHAPPANNECSVPPCGPSGLTGGSQGGSGSGGSGGSGASGGISPDSGPAASGDASTASLTGALLVFDDQGFAVTRPFSGAGTVTVFDPGSPAIRHTATFSGSSYSATVPLANPLWVGIQSTTSSEVLPTLMEVDGTKPTAADVGFAQTAMLELIFSGLQSNPQTMQSTRAQLVVRFVDSAGAPLSGVQLLLAPAGAVVAYDNGSLYSDLPAFAATQGRGAVVVLNAPASPWPGGKVTVNYQHGTPAVLGAFDVYLARGAVTVVTVHPPNT